MLRKAQYRPTVMHLEERAVPGSVLTRPDLSSALGSALTLALEATGTDAIAIASYEAQVKVDVGHHDTGDPSNHTATDGASHAPIDARPIHNPSAATGGDLNDDNGGQTLPPPPSHRQYLDLGFLNGSFLQVGQNSSPITFGDDPPTEGWTHVSINPLDKIVGSPKHFNLPPYTASQLGYHFSAQLEDLSKMTGTYDPTTGNSSASVALDVYITSPDAPNFDNQHCRIPAVTLNFSTDNGTPFVTDPNNPGREIGTMVDNTFAAPAVPTGACGSLGFIDYASIVNGNFGLPSAAGNNTFSLNLAITPAIGP